MPDAAIIPFDQGRPRKNRRRTAPPPPAGPTLAEAYASWELALRARNRAEGTKRSYRDTVTFFAAWLKRQGYPGDIEGITTEHVRQFLAEDSERNSPGNAAKHFRNLRALFNWLVKEGERTTPSPVDSDDKPHVPGEDKPPLTPEELAALLKTCSGNTFADRRDTAIIMTIYDNGVRVSGLAGLRYTPDDEDQHDVFPGKGLLRVRLKGGRIHWAPLARQAALAVDRYIRARARHPLARTEPWLWLGERGRLKTSGIQQMLVRRGRQAGIAGRMHPHRLRYSFADSYLENGGDPFDLKEIGGWSSMAMVEHYTAARAAARARKAHGQFSPGDHLKG